MSCDTNPLHKSFCLMLIPAIALMSAAFACICECSALSISGTKFEDKNNDSFLNSDESGVPGWTIRLYHNGQWTLATTDAGGRYTFGNLTPGEYTVIEDHRSGWRQSFPGCHAFKIKLVDKSADNVDFGDFRLDIDKENQSSTEYQPVDYTFMKTSSQELLRWAEITRRMPKAPLAPEIEITKGQDQGSRFSLLDKLEYCPAERNQGKCGNCWVWASMGMVEIDMAVRKGIKDRLSIQYINSQQWCCGGGLNSQFADIVNSTGIVIPWTNANGQWLEGGIWRNNQSGVPASSISTNPSYAIDYIVPQEVQTFDVGGRDVAIRNIKNILRQGKALYFGFVLPTNEDKAKFGKFWANESEIDVIDIDFACGRTFSDSEGSGHAVLCVGYDDTDPKNRYWIMVNSWGDEPKRPGGLFRVNMDMNYDCTYPYGDDEIIAFYWYAFDVHYPGTVQEAASKPAGAASGSQIYRSLGTARSTGISISPSPIPETQNECKSCNSSRFWAPISSNGSSPIDHLAFSR